MKLLLVQLSDIHIRSSDDAILSRSGKIADAIQGTHYPADACVLVLSGDIAFSGSEVQFALAYDFLQEVGTCLRKSWGESHQIDIVSVPGNHDCDFSNPSPVRDVIVETIDPSRQGVEGAIIKVCTEVQRAYFDFQEIVEGDSRHSDLIWEREISVGDEFVLFRCFNTAWLSQLREVPGTSFVPGDTLSLSRTSAALSIAVLHHPYNWMEPNNARALRLAVERSTDIVLTGHEHVRSRKIQYLDTGEVNEYIEGGVLQESGDPAVSSFNVLLLDLQAQQQRYIHFAWDGEIYRASTQPPDWEAYQVTKLNERNRFAINDTFHAHLLDPGIRLEHPTKGVLSLEDIYVYPDLREMKYKATDSTGNVFHGEDLFFHTFTDNVLILGDEQSGKTALAKKLFRHYHDRGFVPLLLDGAALKLNNLDRAVDVFVKVFSDQYEASNADHYRQLERTRRVLIIDNFHRFNLRRHDADAVLFAMERFAGKLIFLANDLAQQLNDIAEGGLLLEQRDDFREFRILPFGHVLRNVFAEQYCLLDPNASEDQQRLAEKLILLERVMDTVIGKNFVPPYPVFLLAVLQGQEGTTPFNTSAGTYGYYYELLIRNSLARGADRVQMDIRLGYLAHLAWEVYSLGTKEFSSGELRSIHDKYEARYSYSLHFDSSVRELVNRGLLRRIGDDTYAFQYPYIFYYFVASYLRDHMADPLVRDEVGRLSGQLNEEDSANIMLFLAHLSKDPHIIGEMLTNAAKQYSGFEPAALRDDTRFLRPEGETVITKYVERDVAAARRERLQQLDRAMHEDDELPVFTEGDEDGEEFDKLVHMFNRLHGALRTMQILGQLLKNFVGTMDGEQKTNIAEAVYSLGLRVLSSLIKLIEASHFDLLRHHIDALRAEHPDLSELERAQIARASIFSIAHMVAFGMIKRVSHAVGSQDLKLTYDVVRDKFRTPAVDLIHTSIILDQLGLFPQREIVKLGQVLDGNPLPESVLRHLVVNHFHMFNVHFQVKQSICDQLGISYERLRKANPAQRMISGPAQKAVEKRTES